MTMIKGITISSSSATSVQEPQMTTPLSLKDMNKSPISRTSTTQTSSPLMQPQATQSNPSVTNKATDSNDLVRLVHKMSMTEIPSKRDQIVHTADLIVVHQTGTNTPTLGVTPLMRSTASNTNLISVKSIGVNPCEQQVELMGNNIVNSSKIPRPSPMSQRKFMRQETFTVTTNNLPAYSDTIKECPAERLFK